MTNLQKYAPVATIIAAVIGVIALFRKTGDTIVTNNQAPVTFPGMAPLSLDEPAGNGVGTNRQYNGAARGNQFTNSPGGLGAPQNGLLPSYLTSNLAPWNNGLLDAIARANALLPSDSQPTPNQGGAGGCSGGCSGCSGGANPPCNTPTQQNKMLDGAGACFAGGPAGRKQPVTHGQVANIELYRAEQPQYNYRVSAAGD